MGMGVLHKGALVKQKNDREEYFDMFYSCMGWKQSPWESCLFEPFAQTVSCISRSLKD